MAKATIATLPSAAPPASSAAAFRPRHSPRPPALRLRRISCRSISVALAQNITGSARKSPPIDAPNAELISPVSTVAPPPNAKRMRYSYHRPSESDDVESWICTTIPEQPYVIQGQRSARAEARPVLLSEHRRGYALRSGKQRCCSRARRCLREPLSLPERRHTGSHVEPRRCQAWSGAEQPRKALGPKNVSNDGEQRDKEAANDKAHLIFGHRFRPRERTRRKYASG